MLSPCYHPGPGQPRVHSAPWVAECAHEMLMSIYLRTLMPGVLKSPVGLAPTRLKGPPSVHVNAFLDNLIAEHWGLVCQCKLSVRVGGSWLPGCWPGGRPGSGLWSRSPAPSMGLRLGMNRERLTTSTSALSVTCLSPPPRAACPSFGYKHQPALSTNPLFH